MDGTKPKTNPNPKAPYRRYPWEDWWRRRAFRLVRGTDYDVRTDLMVQQLRNRAGRDGYSLHVDVSDDGRTIRVRARPKAEPFPRGRKPIEEQ